MLNKRPKAEQALLVEKRNEFINEAKKSGFSVTQIADIFNVNHAVISRAEKTPLAENYFISFSRYENDSLSMIKCPFCNFDYVHVVSIKKEKKYYFANGTVTISFYCENNEIEHRWKIGFGEHKGNTFTFLDF